ncbi:MAG: hypothetical protein LUE86_11465 [Clostridiales bacterium]|nr:hypothetical protein [Clostridiales bacterium]
MACILDAVLIPLEQSLTAIEGFDGWMIGNAKLTCQGGLPSGAVSCPPPFLCRRTPKLAQIEARAVWPGGWATIRMMLIRPDQSQSGEAQENRTANFFAGQSHAHGKPFRISDEELTHFLEMVPDGNPIHRGDDAILPGMLIMNRLLDRIWNEIARPPETFHAEIRFRLPLHKNETWYLTVGREDDSRLAKRQNLPSAASSECFGKIHNGVGRQAVDLRLSLKRQSLPPAASSECFGK